MAEEPDNLVLTLRRETRHRLDVMDEKIDDLKVGQNSPSRMLMPLAGYRDIDVRVEHLEERIGGQP